MKGACVAIILTLIILIYYTQQCQCGCGEKMSSVVNATRTVTLHYTNWCGYCKLMKPVWERVKKSTETSGIIYKESDEDLTPTAGIISYPTITMLDKDGRRSQYPAGADFEKLRAWVVDRTRNDK